MSTGSATSDSHDFSNYKTMGPNYQPSWNPESTTIQKNPQIQSCPFLSNVSYKKNTFPITSTYSSLLFLTSMLQQATWAQICCVGIQRLICWYPVPGHPLRLPTKCLAHAPSFRLIYKGFAFFKGWKWKIYRLTIVQSGFLWFWGCFWKTGLGWVKSHASMS